MTKTTVEFKPKPPISMANDVPQPKKWLLVVCSVLGSFTGFLYLGRFKWLLLYSLLTLITVMGQLYAPHAVWDVVFYLIYVVGVVHCLYLGWQVQAQGWNRYHIGLKAFLVICVTWLVMRCFVINYYTQPSRSMLPNIETNSMVLMKRWGWGILNPIFGKQYPLQDLKRGDIIFFQYPENPNIIYIKRVVALPNDRVAFIHGNMVLNGKIVPVSVASNTVEASNIQVFQEHNTDQNYTIYRQAHVTQTQYPFMNTCPKTDLGHECIVPKNQLFVLGDNREESSDSRYWGYVPATHIVGTLWR